MTINGSHMTTKIHSRKKLTGQMELGLAVPLYGLLTWVCCIFSKEDYKGHIVNTILQQMTTNGQLTKHLPEMTTLAKSPVCYKLISRYHWPKWWKPSLQAVVTNYPRPWIWTIYKPRAVRHR